MVRAYLLLSSRGIPSAAPQVLRIDDPAMLFRSYRHALHFSDFVDSFWLYDGYESPHFKERILPSGTFELVFNLHDDELRIYEAVHADHCESSWVQLFQDRIADFF
jgi:hypothetical protein